MAYAERMPGKSRTLAVVTVAGLHGIALYGLITGLGVDYVKDAITVLQGHNVPIDRPLPPPLPPQIEEATPKPATQSVTRSIEVGPNPLSRAEPVTVSDVPFIDLPKIDPVGLIVIPTSDKPAFEARSARPRNDPSGWVNTSDYPSSALRRGDQGSVRFELALSADGRVTDCRITASSGFADLDAATCQHVSRRARFEPAVDTTGARMPGRYSGSIRWVIPRD